MPGFERPNRRKAQHPSIRRLLQPIRDQGVAGSAGSDEKSRESLKISTLRGVFLHVESSDVAFFDIVDPAQGSRTGPRSMESGFHRCSDGPSRQVRPGTCTPFRGAVASLVEPHGDDNGLRNGPRRAERGGECRAGPGATPGSEKPASSTGDLLDRPVGRWTGLRQGLPRGGRARSCARTSRSPGSAAAGRKPVEEADVAGPRRTGCERGRPFSLGGSGPSSPKISSTSARRNRWLF